MVIDTIAIDGWGGSIDGTEDGDGHGADESECPNMLRSGNGWGDSEDGWSGDGGVDRN